MALIDWTGTRPLEAQEAQSEAMLKVQPDSLFYAEGVDYYVHPAVLSEAMFLKESGYNVRFDSTPDKFAFDRETRREIHEEIATLETQTLETIQATGVNPELLKVGRVAFENWKPLTKRAIALKNIYEPEARTLGEGIDPSVYDRPLFTVRNSEGNTSVISAASALNQTVGEERANKIIGQYKTFIETPIDYPSRKIWQGSLDGEGVRTRATCAMQEVARHVAETKGYGSSITVASLACGAASPVYELMTELDGRGIQVDKAILADMDAMALASAYSLAERDGVSDKVQLCLESLVDMETLDARDLTEFIEPGSVDIADLLGIFEYFPPELATRLLKQVMKVMKPGGIIVLGNMIDKRPQQVFFSDVSLWPELHQRSLTETLGIIQDAGINARKQVSVILPPQGVYAAFSIVVPLESDNIQN